MKVHVFLSLLLLSTFMLCGCTCRHPENITDNTKSDIEITAEPDIDASVPADTQTKTELQEVMMMVRVNGIPLNVIWENNETVSELLAYAENSPITVNSTAYGGFEQVGKLPKSFSENDVQMTTKPGDIVLYSGNQLVVFFGSNSWSYTKLGHINLSVDELTELLRGNTAIIEILAE